MIHYRSSTNCVHKSSICEMLNCTLLLNMTFSNQSCVDIHLILISNFLTPEMSKQK